MHSCQIFLCHDFFPAFSLNLSKSYHIIFCIFFLSYLSFTPWWIKQVRLVTCFIMVFNNEKLSHQKVEIVYFLKWSHPRTKRIQGDSSVLHCTTCTALKNHIISGIRSAHSKNTIMFFNHRTRWRDAVVSSYWTSTMTY